MISWVKRKLGITTLFGRLRLTENQTEILLRRVSALEADFNSREACKICGRHRYVTSRCFETGENKKCTACV